MEQTENMRLTLLRTQDIAIAHGNQIMMPEHLLLALLDDPDCKTVFSALKVDVAKIKEEAEHFIVEHFDVNPRPLQDIDLEKSSAMGTILNRVYYENTTKNPGTIANSKSLLLALMRERGSNAAYLLEKHGIGSAETLDNFLTHGTTVNPKDAAATDNYGLSKRKNPASQQGEEEEDERPPLEQFAVTSASSASRARSPATASAPSRPCTTASRTRSRREGRFAATARSLRGAPR